MIIVYLVICAFLVAVDQTAKLIALSNLKPIGNIEFIKGFMDFTFVENRGAAFGILEGQRWLFVLLTLAVTAIIIGAFLKMPKNREYNMVRASFVLILSGALGNLIDRIFRGYVVDFFEFTFISYPVFNIADIYVVIGALFLAYLMIFVIKENKGKESSADNAGSNENR